MCLAGSWGLVSSLFAALPHVPTLKKSFLLLTITCLFDWHILDKWLSLAYRGLNTPVTG